MCISLCEQRTYSFLHTIFALTTNILSERVYINKHGFEGTLRMATSSLPPLLLLTSYLRYFSVVRKEAFELAHYMHLESPLITRF